VDVREIFESSEAITESVSSPFVRRIEGEARVGMQIRKLINKRIRHSDGGIDVAADVNAVISANVGERGATTHASSTQHVVQRSGRSATSGAETSEKEGT